jgi:two-component system KDP operon response regulator KdpE
MPRAPTNVRSDLRIDLASHEVSLAGEPLRFTRKEFDLLALLARNAGRTVHRQLLADIWGPAHEHDLQYLRVFVGRLRAKLGDDPATPRSILNEPGVGNRFLD